ncbi:DUF2569 family protein [Pigmentiphaga daeguensis]|uniref:DUF2569 domain-containing protein n=1 Tax=Pigmentiphaga daeguensis TaxID=414049 RepID=A0ABN1D168_9BURK
MVINEGARRIVRAISVIAWIALVGTLCLSVAVVFGREPSFAIVVMVAGMIAFAVIQGIAWIIAGFSGNPRDSDGLVRIGNLNLHNAGRAASPKKQRDPGPTGVGGWLLLLSIGLLAFGPIQTIAKTLEAIQTTESSYPNLVGMAAWQTYKIASWALLAVVCAVSFAAGWALLKRHQPSSVQLALTALWVRGPFATLFDAASANAYLGVSFEGYFSDPSFVGECLGSVMIAGIWTAYLMLSRRVRNTYYNKLYPTPS